MDKTTDSEKSDKAVKGGIIDLLSEVQHELKAPKGQVGRFGKHRNVEDILEAVKPLLAARNMSVVLSNGIIEVGGRNYVTAQARVYRGTDFVEATAQAWEGELSRGLDAPQVTGSASSYARKYALGGLFAIDDTKDPDAHMEPAKVMRSTSAPTKSQLDELVKITQIIGLTEENTADFFQDAIGKPRPETKAEFTQAIDFGNTVIDDRGLTRGEEE